ncbi:MAG: sensor domain-containing diguanylate cyclase, partial [Burkholderiales bacterium]
MKSKPIGSAARIALVYVLLAALWIFVSDRLVNASAIDSQTNARLQTLKECVFVAATGYALYALLNARGRAEAALCVAHANYRSLFENATVGIFQSTPKGRFLSVNPATARIFGYQSPEDMLSHIKSIANQIYLDPSSRDEFHRLIVEQGQVHDFTYQALRKDKGVIWIHEDARVVTGADGGVLYYEGFMTDVTERKRAEEERDRLAAIVESSEDAIIGKTLDGVITSWNVGACRLYGYSPEEAIGKSVAFLVPPDRIDELPSILSRLRAGQKVAHLETLRIRKDGTPVDVVITGSPIRDEAGMVTAASSIALDVTGRRRAQDELRRAKDALETTNLELQRALAREEALARTDGLTGLYNRIYFDELATRAFRAALRYQRPLAIMMIDVDNLKGINDTLGHAAGDEALVLIGRTAAAYTRAADLIARLGGDEFILLLPETSAQQAVPIADRIVASVAALQIGDTERALNVP